jgi:hypothetical protein
MEVGFYSLKYPMNTLIIVRLGAARRFYSGKGYAQSRVFVILSSGFVFHPFRSVIDQCPLVFREAWCLGRWIRPCIPWSC